MKSAGLDGANSYLCDPDVRLMLRAKAGEESAFAELTAKYWDYVVRIAGSLVGNHQDAEDIAQQTFFRIYSARCRYEPHSRFSTWMLRIANNLVLNLRRSRARRKELAPVQCDSIATGEHAPVEVADNKAVVPLRLLERIESRAAVATALKALNETQQIATILQAFDGQSYMEIGSALGISPVAAKSLVARARQNLRERLTPYQEFGTRIRERPAEELRYRFDSVS